MLDIIAVVGVLLVALLVFASTRPDSFTVQRRAGIKAPPEKVFAYINDFHQWAQWSPWEKLDPAMKRTYSGTPDGVGAVYAWDGNKKVGAGGMEITQSTAPSSIILKLDFVRPFEGHNITEFTLATSGETTEVTWTMRGPSPFMFKLMGIFMNLDKMIGKDFETGLGNLKAVAEQ